MSIFLALRQSFTFSGLCVLGDTLALGPGQSPVILGCGYSSVQSVLIQEERCCRGAEAVLHLWNCTWVWHEGIEVFEDLNLLGEVESQCSHSLIPTEILLDTPTPQMCWDPNSQCRVGESLLSGAKTGPRTN